MFAHVKSSHCRAPPRARGRRTPLVAKLRQRDGQINAKPNIDYERDHVTTSPGRPPRSSDNLQDLLDDAPKLQKILAMLGKDYDETVEKELAKTLNLADTYSLIKILQNKLLTQLCLDLGSDMLHQRSQSVLHVLVRKALLGL